MLTAQKKLFLSLSIGLAGLAVFVGLIIYPLINRISIASKECFNNQEILSKLEQRISLLKELRKNYKDNQPDLLSLEKAFLDPEETVGFITNLETVAKKTNNSFEIKSVSSNPSDEKESSYLTLNIYLWGSFSKSLDFLANLENIPYPPYRLIKIDNLTIKRLAKEEGDLETILSIKVYTQ